MKRLLLDTSTQALIIILLDDNEVIDYVFKIVERNHSTILMPNISEILEKNNLKIKDIDEIIVGNGPGSYTGIRIGVTVAKTLSYTLNIPLKKVSTLKLLSVSLFEEAKFIGSLIDARRKNVFAALYKVNGGRLETVLEDKLYNYQSFLAKVIELTGNKDTFLISNDKLQNENDNFRFLKDVFNPKMVKYLDFETVEEIHSFVPNYQRMTEAEMNLK